MRRFNLTLLAALMLALILPVSAQRDVLQTGIDLVLVPVSVRDTKGVLIRNLMQDDFRIFEDGRPQEIRSFSIESMPLSIALMIDTGVDKPALTNIADSLRAFPKAFSESDEVEAYRFDHINNKVSDFIASPAELARRLGFLKNMAERQANRPAPLTVLPGRGPKWLREFLGLDEGIEFKNLNDPLFMAAVDLERRPKERRRIIIVISDGGVPDDNKRIVHTTSHTRDRLEFDQIQVYGIAVGNALLEGPTSILHFYASATGGDVYRGHDRYDIEDALTAITTQARREYVLGYVSNNEVHGLLPLTRKIKVEAIADDLKVHHRSSYLQYPKR